MGAFIWRGISLAVMVSLFVLPLLTFFVWNGGIALTVLGIIAFWPSTAIVIRNSLRDKQWPVITGGPGVSWNGSGRRG